MAKLCECGCGEPTKLSERADGTYAKGEARRFLSGHQFRKNIADRIKKWTKRNEQTGCLEWQGALSHGYGYVHFKGKPRAAHIVAYVLAHGEVPEGLFVCHRCDNPLCCEEGHLFPGTHQDNVDDCVAKDRQPRGSRNAHAKLTEAQVVLMRAQLESGAGLQEIADQYAVSIPTVSMIRSRKTWRHI